MLNIVIPITKNLDKYRNLLEGVAGSFDIKVLLGVKHDLYQAVVNEFGQVENFDLFEFDNGADKEEIINAMQDYLVDGSIMILRKPISVKEFDKIIKSDRDIVTSKKVRTKFQTFLLNFWQKITKMILGVKMYAGDYSMVLFSQDIADVVMRTGNLSYSSRVNRWKGIKQGVITTEERADKQEIDHKLNVRNILLAVILIAIGAIVTTVVSIFVDMTIIIGLFLFCLDAICLCVAGILIVIVIFTNLTGKKHYNKALIMNKNVKSEEV